MGVVVNCTLWNTQTAPRRMKILIACLFLALVVQSCHALVIELAPDYQCPGDGSFPNLEDACDSFYMCSGGKHHKMTCNPGLKFDGSIGQCNWEQEVDDNCNWNDDAIAIG